MDHYRQHPSGHPWVDSTVGHCRHSPRSLHQSLDTSLLHRYLLFCNGYGASSFVLGWASTQLLPQPSGARGCRWGETQCLKIRAGALPALPFLHNTRGITLVPQGWYLQ